MKKKVLISLVFGLLLIYSRVSAQESLDKMSWEEMFNYGRALELEERYDEALRVYIKALRVGKDRWGYRWARPRVMRVLMAKGEHELAYDRFTDEIQAGEEKADLHFQLGQIYLKKKMYGEASLEFKKALILRPEDSQAYKTLKTIPYKRKNERYLRNNRRMRWQYVIARGIENIPVGICKDTVYFPTCSFAYYPNTLENMRRGRRYSEDLVAASINDGSIKWTFSSATLIPEAGNASSSWLRLTVKQIETGERVLVIVFLKMRWRGNFGAPAGYHICGLDARTGKLLWNQPFPARGRFPRISAPIMGKIICSFSNKNVCALDIKTGEIKWSNEAEGLIEGSPSVQGSKIYIATWPERIYALDLIDGRIEWESQAVNRPKTSPVVSEDKVFVGSDDNHLYALDTQDGHLIWKYETFGAIQTTDNPGGYNSPVFHWKYRTPLAPQGIVFAASSDRFIYALDAKSGRLLWKVEMEKPAMNLLVHKKILYAAGGSFEGTRFLHALDALKGSLLWRYPVIELASFCVKDDVLLIGERGRIIALNISDYRNPRAEKLCKLAEELFEEGKSDLAIEVIQTVTDVVGPGHSQAYFLLAKIHQELGQIEEAKTKCKEYLDYVDLNSKEAEKGKRFLQTISPLCWVTKIGSTESRVSAALLNDNQLIVGCNGTRDSSDSASNNTVWSLSTEDASVNWRYELDRPTTRWGVFPDAVGNSLMVDNNTVYFGSHRAKAYSGPGEEHSIVHAVRLKDGKQKWKFKAKGDAYFAPSLHKGLLYIASIDNINRKDPSGRFYALDAGTGELVWEFSTKVPQYDSLRDYPEVSHYSMPAVWRELILWAWQDGRLYALKRATGKLVWEFEPEDEPLGSRLAHLSSVVLLGDRAYVASEDGYIYALNASDGGLIWKYKHKEAKRGKLTPGVTGGGFGDLAIHEPKGWLLDSFSGDEDTLYVCHTNGHFYAFDAKTGKIKWEIKGQIMGWPLHKRRPHPSPISNGRIYLLASDKTCKVADISTGQIIGQFKELADLLVVGDGTLYLMGEGKVTAFNLEE